MDLILVHGTMRRRNPPTLSNFRVCIRSYRHGKGGDEGGRRYDYRPNIICRTWGEIETSRKQYDHF